eukprot:gene778-966_t
MGIGSSTNNNNNNGGGSNGGGGSGGIGVGVGVGTDPMSLLVGGGLSNNNVSDDIKLLVSQYPVPLELDKFMESILFSFNFSETSNHSFVLYMLQELSKRIANNNPVSKNFNSIVLHYISKINSFNEQLVTLSKSEIQAAQTAAVSTSSTSPSLRKSSTSVLPLHIDHSIEVQLYTHQQYLINYTILLQSFVRYFIENMDKVDLLHQFMGQDSQFSTLPNDLIYSIINFLSNDSKDYSYDLHIVLLNFLLILFSTEMFLPLPSPIEEEQQQEEKETEEDNTQTTFQLNEKNLFLNIIMEMGRDQSKSIVINKFINSLFHNIVQHKPRPTSSTGILSSIGNAASYILLIPWNAYKYFFPQTSISESKITELSLYNILVLIQYNYPNGNPFKMILKSIQDKDFSQIESLNNSSDNGHTIRISMSNLYNYIIKSPSSDKNILLLYYLLQENTFFFKYVQSRTDLDNLELNLVDLHSDELKTHLDFLYIVFQIVNNTLTYRPHTNPNLIYELILQQDESLPRFSNNEPENLLLLSNNIFSIISYFNSAIFERSKENPEANEDQSMEEFIEMKAKSLPVPPLDQESILRFKYEEESNSFEFITPYIWAIIFNYSTDKWDTRNITLFPTRLSTASSSNFDLDQFNNLNLNLDFPLNNNNNNNNNNNSLNNQQQQPDSSVTSPTISNPQVSIV